MTRSPKALIVKLFALAISTLPVAIATLSYFPVWKNRGIGALISGFTVFLLLICFYPFVKAIKRFFKSPSIFTIWLLLFILFSIVDSIAYEMTVISFVGMISNFLGSVIFKIARGLEVKR